MSGGEEEGIASWTAFASTMGVGAGVLWGKPVLRTVDPGAALASALSTGYP